MVPPPRGTLGKFGKSMVTLPVRGCNGSSGRFMRLQKKDHEWCAPVLGPLSESAGAEWVPNGCRTRRRVFGNDSRPSSQGARPPQGRRDSTEYSTTRQKKPFYSYFGNTQSYLSGGYDTTPFSGGNSPTPVPTRDTGRKTTPPFSYDEVCCCGGVLMEHPRAWQRPLRDFRRGAVFFATP